MLPNIRDDEIATVKAELENDPQAIGYAQADSAGKARLLVNRLMIDNPNPPAQVPRTLVMLEVFGILSNQANAYLLGLSVTDQKTIANDFAAQDRAAIKNWGFFKSAAGLFTAEDAAAINAYCDGTVDDPNHSSRVLGPNRLTVLLGREVGGISASEVESILA